jgi:hypothetical protein
LLPCRSSPLPRISRPWFEDRRPAGPSAELDRFVALKVSSGKALDEGDASGIAQGGVPERVRARLAVGTWTR